MPRAATASLLVHPTQSLVLAHVPRATRIAQLVLARHLTSVQAARLVDLYSRTAAAFRRAPKPNFLITRVEAVRHAIAAVRVALVLAQVIASHAQARPRSFAGDLVWQPTVAGAGRPLSPASACVSRILSLFRRFQELRLSRFPRLRGSTRPP